MLKKFRVSNFKNLLNVEFRPVGVNLLIGPNNAGKTNLCNALRFFCGTSTWTLDESATFALGESWNITNVNVSEKVMEMEAEVDLTVNHEYYSFNYLLRLSADRDQAVWRQPLKVIEERLVVTGEAFHNHMLIENRLGAAKLTNERASLDPGSNRETMIESQVPPECTALSKIYDVEVNRLAMLFKRFLGNCMYFALEPRALRNPKVVDKTLLPSPAGDNFSKFLFTVHNEKPRLERKVIEALRVLEPKLDFFNFYTPNPDFVHFIMEDKLGNKFSAQSMSDGTLRYLALCLAVMILADSPSSPSPPGLIIFEEPENGLYVGLLKPLFEQMDFTGRNGQVIFTTHSPYVIDLFDARLEAVHLMKPGSPSAVLTKLHANLVKKLLDDMPLGEMHYREMLG